MTFIRSMQILIVIVIICILIAGAFALGFYYGKEQQSVTNQSEKPTAIADEIQESIDKAIEESGVTTGTLVSINDKQLTIDSQMPILDPSQTPTTKRKVISLTDKTIITKRTTKPTAEIQKAQEAFIQSIINNTGTSTASITPPTTYTETPATVADLVVGSVLTINTVQEGNKQVATTIAIN